MAMNKVAELAQWAGIVGAGGAGFPTHVKLNASVNVVIVNAAECEPLITVDQHLIQEYAPQLGSELERVRQEVEAKKAIIALKSKHKEAVAALESVLCHYQHIELMQIGDFYPAGDEFALVYEVLNKRVPPGGIPLEIGAVVINVETLWNLSQAAAGHVVTDKWVTVAGSVNGPGTFHVPLGVTVNDMLNLAGGPSRADFAVLDGGPIMGKLVGNLNQPIVKTTKGLTVLPATSPVITMRKMPMAHILRLARAACCQCRECTDLCPRHLLGHHLEPHKAMQIVSYPGYNLQSVSEAFLCSECGMCDLYACPMGLSPRRIYQALKQELAEKGIKNPYKGVAGEVHAWRDFRRVPTNRMIKRLGLMDYKQVPPLSGLTIRPKKVILPLKQHVGAPALVTVKAGQRVKKGELLADIPEGKLAARLHASIDGKVAAVTPEIAIISVAEKEANSYA